MRDAGAARAERSKARGPHAPDRRAPQSCAGATCVRGLGSKVVLQTDLMEIDTRVRVLDAGVREVLNAIAQIVVLLRTKTIPEPYMVAELEIRTHVLVADGRLGKQMETDSKFRI